MSADLTPFVEDNARWRQQRKRVPWEERLELIEKHFPGVNNVEWNVVLRDNDIFGRILRDILKIDQVEPGRAGPRPNLNYEKGMQTWREITGQDFCELAFPQAFRLLTRNQSYTTIARKTRLSRSKIYRLMQGTEHPSAEDLRVCAAAYGKKPAWFAEYRAEYILAAMAKRLANEPEMTIAIYMKLLRAAS